MNHRAGSIAFGIIVGLVAAVWSYHWITDPGRRALREQQETLVLSSRDWVSDALGIEFVEFVDPLAPQRKVGKVYILPTDSGWEISGYYRRDDADDWHDYILTVDSSGALAHLKVRDSDAGVIARGAVDTGLEVVSD